PAARGPASRNARAGRAPAPGAGYAPSPRRPPRRARTGRSPAAAPPSRRAGSADRVDRSGARLGKRRARVWRHADPYWFLSGRRGRLLPPWPETLPHLLL